MNFKYFILIFLMCTTSSVVKSEQIYKCTDEAGKKSFQSRPCKGDKIVVEGITTLRDGMQIKPKLAGQAVAKSNEPSNN